jgi:hypothetical protein
MITQPTRLLTLAVVLLLAGLPARAAGQLELRYIEPAHYRDIGHGAYERERNLKSLADYLQSLAAQLPDGQTLKLEVLDIDLAGELQHHAAQEIRVLRGRADWPQMQLRYTLMQGPVTLKSGDALLSDLGYLDHLRGSESAYGDLPYDKRMLQDWFRQTITAP